MTEGAPATTTEDHVLVCPRCGTGSPADARLCRRCFASLEGAARADAPTTAKRRRRLQLSVPSTARGWTALVLGVLVLLFVARSLPGWLSGPPSPFPAVSGTRSVGAAGVAWTMPGGDLSGTRRTDADVSLFSTQQWRWTATSAPSTSLVSDGEAVYVGLEEGVLVAVSAADGAERWRATVPGVLESAPSIAGGRLFVGYRSGSVAALDVADGARIWETQLGVSISTTPAVVDGIVFVAGNGVIGAFDAENGALIWRQEISDTVVPASPVVDEATLVVATFDRVLIFDRRNGALLSWMKLAPQHAPVSSIAIDQGVIYVTADQQLLAIATSMRRPWWDGVRPLWDFLHVVGAAPDPPWRPDLWTISIPRNSYPAAISEEQVVVASSSGRLAAYERGSGATRWEVELGPIAAPPVVAASGLLAVGSDHGWLVADGDGGMIAEGALSDAPLDVVPVESRTFLLTVTGIDGVSPAGTN